MRVMRVAVTARALPHLLSPLYQSLLPPTTNKALSQAQVPAAVAAAAVRVRTSHQMTPHLLMMMMVTTVRVREGMGTRRMVMGQLGQGVGAHREPVAVTVAVIAGVAAIAVVAAAAMAAATAAAEAAVTAAMTSRPMRPVMGRKEATQCPLLQLQLLPPTASSKLSSSISDSRHQR